ncbi:MAG: alpha/beta hydrolase [Clostridiales bacterium]|nr:alpha/beta hydrolase [Clostridiales bacterium]
MKKESVLSIRQENDRMNRAVDVKQFPKEFLNIRYAPDAKEQKMDIFLPGTDGVYPVVLLVHGGGWAWGGRREECLSSVFQIISQGYALATMDYRRCPEYEWPAHIEDVQTAIRFLKTHGSEYQLDMTHLVVWGNSAGAHICELAGAMSGKEPWIGKNDLYPGADNVIDGVISMYGVSDFTLEEMRGTPLFDDDVPYETLEKASAFYYVDAHYPKILFQHGDADQMVPCGQSVRMHDHIQGICGPDRSTLEIFHGARHASPEFKTPENIHRCVRWLDQIYFAGREIPPRPELPNIKLVNTDDDRADPFEQHVTNLNQQ